TAGAQKPYAAKWCFIEASEFSTSMTSGAMATTRRSTAAVVHVVHPRFDAPATTKRDTVTPPPADEALNAVTASMARTALLVIGNWAGQRTSPVSRNLFQV